MRLRHLLIHHSPAAAADQIAELVAQEAVFLEGDNGLLRVASLGLSHCFRNIGTAEPMVDWLSWSSLLVSNTQYHRNRK